MTCGGMMEIGRGYLGILLEIKMEIMELKVFHRPQIFLQADTTRLVGLILMETFGCLVGFSQVILTIYMHV
jgi:hypothetical protein